MSSETTEALSSTEGGSQTVDTLTLTYEGYPSVVVNSHVLSALGLLKDLKQHLALIHQDRGLGPCVEDLENQLLCWLVEGVG
ncbi:MAG: hypothetical protein ACE5OZ_23240 [Candidatus Heimdallarchaeota archaeon]